MANEGFTSDNAASLIQIATVEAMMAISQGAFLRDYVTVRNVKGKTARFPLYGDIEAADLTEGIPIATHTDLTTTHIDVTAAEVGLSVPVSDIMDLGYEQAFADAGKALGNAIKKKINQDIFGLNVDGWTQSIGVSFDGTGVPSVYAEISEDLLAEALRILNANNAPKPYVVVATPYAYSKLLKLYSSNTNTTADGFKNAALGAGVVPDIYGMKVLQYNDLSTSEAADNVAYCGVFSAAGIGYAQGWDIKIEPQRSALLRGTYLVGTSFYGVKVINADWGVTLAVNNTPIEAEE